MPNEFKTIQGLARIFSSSKVSPNSLISLGIGDDAALLNTSSLSHDTQWVWTIDASVENVHFRRSWLTFKDIGYRATVAAISDIFAMGGQPIAILAALTLPTDSTLVLQKEDIQALAEGQQQAAEIANATIVGGNISSGPCLSISTTVLGISQKPIRRNGARIGDLIAIVGPVGWASLGLAWLQAQCVESEAAFAIQAWRHPVVLHQEAHALASIANAMIDVSDGLAQDVGHIAESSNVGIVLYEEKLIRRRNNNFASMAQKLHKDPLQLELAGGEDYALIAAIPPNSVVPETVDVLGECIQGCGVLIQRTTGKLKLAPSGFEHI